MHLNQARVLVAMVGSMLFVATSTAVSADGPLSVPATGVVDMEEGTFECWINFDFDPIAVELDRHGRRLVGWGHVITVTTGDQIQPAFLSLSLFTKIGRLDEKNFFGRTYVGGMPKPGHCYMTFSNKTRKETWYHIAVTWTRDTYNIYIDGKEERAYDGKRTDSFKARFGEEARVLIGLGAQRIGKRRGQRFMIDDLRISSIARSPQDLGFHGQLKPDIFTTLLLDFDSPSSLGDQLPDYVELKPGKFGDALYFKPLN